MENADRSHLFQHKLALINQFKEEWNALKEQLIPSIAKQRPSILDDIDLLDSATSRALSYLREALTHPTISIAVTGTTSSGKSTLVNMLCGHPIMPTLTQEISAGVVTIHHGPDKNRQLEIVATKGALWETGKWENLDDESIRKRLEEVMLSYNASRNMEAAPACPVFNLHFPLRIGMDSAHLGLPPTYHLEIIDLPGLKSVDDDVNAEVVQHCRQSLCIVTINCADTDPKKRERLVQEIMRHVKMLGGTPARMLFVLNRFDEFLNDEAPQKSAEGFKNELQEKISRDLKNNFPEHAHPSYDVALHRLSPLPALLSIRIQDGSLDEQWVAGKIIDNRFGMLIPEEILDDLPRRIERWTSHDMTRVALAVWRTSHGAEFLSTLKHHIQAHVPELILPQLFEKFRGMLSVNSLGGRHLIQWALHLIRAEMNASEDQYQLECERLKSKQRLIEAQRKLLGNDILTPFEEIRSRLKDVSFSPHIFEHVQRISEEIARTYRHRLSKRQLNPLFSWMDNLLEASLKFIEEMAFWLEAGNPSVLTISESLTCYNRTAVYNAVTSLIHNGYRLYRGKTVTTREHKEKVKLMVLNDSLNTMAEALSTAMKEVIAREADQQKERILYALKALFETQLVYLWEKAQEIDPNLGFGVPPQIQLDFVASDLNLDFNFEAGFDRKIIERMDEVAKRKTTVTQVEKVGEKRLWYTFWLVKMDVLKEITSIVEKPVFEKRMYNQSSIPDIDDLLVSFMNQIKVQQPMIVRQFLEWVCDQIVKLNDQIKQAQETLLKRYQDELNQAHKHAETSREHQKRGLTDMLDATKALELLLKQIVRSDNSNCSITVFDNY